MLGKQLQTAAAGNAGSRAYIEDVFSTWLYTGNGSTQTITNGIDLAGEGGAVWVKKRSGGQNHSLQDTVQGITKSGVPNATSAYATSATRVTSISSTGFSVGNDSDVNENTYTYASWTFRKAEKFFDIVTYTGTGTGTTQTINHSLGSVPGLIIIKKRDGTSPWIIWHRSLTSTYYLQFSTAAANDSSNTDYFGNNVTTVEPTSTTFTVGQASAVNSGDLVAYLFAHDAGGFGDDGTESVIKCGSYSGSSSSVDVSLGWEPQWILIKRSDTGNAAYGWFIFDNMRGISTGGTDPDLWANNTSQEGGNLGFGDYVDVTATGYTVKPNTPALSASGGTYIYIAIRRGPMKTPTSGTEVFNALNAAGTSAATTITTGFTTDLFIRKASDGAYVPFWLDRFRNNAYLDSSATTAESTGATAFASGLFASNTGFAIATGATAVNSSSFNYSTYAFRRAPGFFDVVAYTGTGSARTVAHNLGVVPELMIVKKRTNSSNWAAYDAFNGGTKYLTPNDNSASTVSSTVWNDTNPTSLVFTVGTASRVGTSGANYIAYLFATCPGVSKCFNFTGTGTTLQIDCGFASGARFVMIKRTDSTGDWYVWDSARGIISGNDPYLLLNSTAAEVTNTDYIDPYSAGFEISSTAPAAINANGGSYIGLAIA